MTLAIACAVTACRALLVGVLGILIATLADGELRASRPVIRRAIWGALLALFLAPDLMLGYVYAQLWPTAAGWLAPWTWGGSVSSIDTLKQPWNEVWLALLSLIKVLPLSTAIWHFTPPGPISRSAMHLRGLTPGHLGLAAWLSRAIWYCQRNLRRLVFAICVPGLYVFQEFELVSRLQAHSWTVWIFDAHAGGQPLSNSLQWAILPALGSLVFLAPAAWFARGALQPVSEGTREPASASPARSAMCWVLIAAALFFAWIAPVGLLLPRTAPQVLVLWRDTVHRETLLREVSQTLAVAALAGVLAFMVTRKWQSHLASAISSRPPLLRAICVVSILPGLMGTLVLGLFIRALFLQGDMLAARWGGPRLYDTVTPWILALFLWLLPRALLLRGLMAHVGESSAAHLGGLLAATGTHASTRQAGAALWWQTRGQAACLSLALLTSLGYWDLATAALLAPTDVVSAPVRLYNFMHFGQTPFLTAQLTLTVCLPLFVGACGFGAVRFLAVWMFRPAQVVKSSPE